MVNAFPDVPSNITSIEMLLPHINTVSEGYFGTVILLTIFSITFIIGKRYSTEKALSFSSFLTLLIGIMFRMLNVINDGVLTFIIMFFIGIVIYMFFSRQQES